MEHVLVTGGAGFIGRHVTRELLSRGHRVRVLDSLVAQVHGGAGHRDNGREGIEFLHADIRDGESVQRALAGIDSVVHLAAEVGVGQSMYEVERYTSANDLGTAVLFQNLVAHPVRRVVTASSMSIYGEGLYRDSGGALVENAERNGADAGRSGWNPLGPDGVPLVPVPTPEWKRPSLASVYALNKYAQERTTHILAPAYGMEGVCLRLFNVYGPGQALSNPYTGVLAIFASRLLHNERPMIYEDGEQRRDFVHVRDVARAFADALERPQAAGRTFNVGSGRDRSIRQVALDLAGAMGKEECEPVILGKARVGDIRHCFCDIGLAARHLDFRAEVDFRDGLAELVEWLAGQEAEDRFDQARTELEARGLVA